MAWLSGVRSWARTLKRDVVALWFAARDPRTPWTAKLLAGCVAAYALSPVDLIPDFIPVVGYLDDLVLVPLGVLVVVKLVPAPLMQEFRAKAAELDQRPKSRTGLAMVVLVWILTLGALGAAIAGRIHSPRRAQGIRSMNR